VSYELHLANKLGLAFCSAMLPYTDAQGQHRSPQFWTGGTRRPSSHTEWGGMGFNQYGLAEPRL